ncbi:site-specific DNA-methyltransferase [Paracoccus sp. (in: a-proteobacteria)]|uniref:DNA-methyltransferase n=1 Tax=Paracoccus sp. TaxID=267 RepID=UPI002AFFCFE1|nr:site-specific DNA-methyltransferase [Paracoccus sp. (in: a-proteobacteria)]
MTPETFLSGRVTLWPGDVRAALAAMEPDSVDCIVTSPPYWGLRDYGVAGQIGLEPTLAEHLAVMVEVFDLARRALKPTGTLWLNYGDCYATAPNGRSAAETKSAGGDDRAFRDKPFSTVGGGLKPKDLCMIPNRLAIALQDAGWWVRSEIIWGKTNPKPDSSGAYRPSTAHEKIFLLTKSDSAEVWRARDTGEICFAPDLSERCPLVTHPERNGPRWLRMGAYYDAEAVRVEAAPASVRRWAQDIDSQQGSVRANGGAKTNGTMKAVGGARDKQRGHSRRHAGFNDRWDAMGREEQCANGRYLRNYEPAPLTIWPMGTKPFSEAHFATFPPELATRCISAGCPPGGLVLDPFGGAGTTALSALRLGRRAALVELNPEYAAIARRRIEADWAGPMARSLRGESAVGHGPLFGGEAAE